VDIQYVYIARSGVDMTSKLTTKEMIAIAKEAKKTKAELAFRLSGVTTILSEPEKKTESMLIKLSPDEKQRFKRLAEVVQLPVSSIIRAAMKQLCDDMGVE